MGVPEEGAVAKRGGAPGRDQTQPINEFRAQPLPKRFQISPEI